MADKCSLNNLNFLMVKKINALSNIIISPLPSIKKPLVLAISRQL